MECRSTVSQQVARLLRGRKVDPVVASCRGDGDGSNNWIHGEAVATQDWDHLGELATRDRTEGALCRISAGSELYNPDVVVYRVIGLARMPDNHPAREPVRAALATQLAFYSLTALPGPRLTTRLNLAGQISTAAGDARYYRGGVSVCLPGHRFHPSVVGQSILGPILSWALGYSPTYPRNRIVFPVDPQEWDDRRAAANGNQVALATVATQRQQAEDAVGNFWPIALLEAVLGRYGLSTPASAWGLTDQLRASLRSVIEHNDLAGVDAALAVLAPFRLFGPLEMEVVATTGGRIARLNHAVNSMKPQLAACSLTTAGAYEAAVPSPWNRLTAALAETEDTGHSFIARADGNAIEVAYPPGLELWRVRWGGANTPARRVGSAAPVVVAPSSPAPPQSAGPSPLSFQEAAVLADQLASLHLAHAHQPLQGHVVDILRGSTNGMSREAARALAFQVATFGIGSGQDQYAAWQRVIAGLRG